NTIAAARATRWLFFNGASICFGAIQVRTARPRPEPRYSKPANHCAGTAPSKCFAIGILMPNSRMQLRARAQCPLFPVTKAWSTLSDRITPHAFPIFSSNVRARVIDTPVGAKLPLNQIAEVRVDQGPNTINRENVQRRIIVQAFSSQWQS